MYFNTYVAGEKRCCILLTPPLQHADKTRYQLFTYLQVSPVCADVAAYHNRGYAADQVDYSMPGCQSACTASYCRQIDACRPKRKLHRLMQMCKTAVCLALPQHRHFNHLHLLRANHPRTVVRRKGVHAKKPTTPHRPE